MRYLTTFRTGSPHSDFLQSKFNLDRQYEVPNTMMKSDLNVAEKKTPQKYKTVTTCSTTKQWCRYIHFGFRTLEYLKHVDKIYICTLHANI